MILVEVQILLEAPSNDGLSLARVGRPIGKHCAIRGVFEK